jgi:hypothetical protein
MQPALPSKGEKPAPTTSDAGTRLLKKSGLAILRANRLSGRSGPGGLHVHVEPWLCRMCIRAGGRPAETTRTLIPKVPSTCNLYSITTNQAAIAALFRVANPYVGNLHPMPGVFPDYPAPVVGNAGAEREMATMRWGMPPPAEVRRCTGHQCPQHQLGVAGVTG